MPNGPAGSDLESKVMDNIPQASHSKLLDFWPIPLDRTDGVSSLALHVLKLPQYMKYVWDLRWIRRTTHEKNWNFSTWTASICLHYKSSSWYHQFFWSASVLPAVKQVYDAAILNIYESDGCSKAWKFWIYVTPNKITCVTSTTSGTKPMQLGRTHVWTKERQERISRKVLNLLPVNHHPHQWVQSSHLRNLLWCGW